MKEFLLNNYSIITHGIEIIAALTGLFLYKKYRLTPVKYFIWFLVYIVIMVQIGSYTRYVAIYDSLSSFRELLKGTLFQRNYWWFTIAWSMVSVVFFSFYYSKVLNSVFNKKVLKITTLAFVLVSLFTIATNWRDFFIKPFPIISVFGAFVILQCVLFYLLEMIKSPNILDFHRSINFYITCTIFVFWLIKTPLVFFEMYYNKADQGYVNLRGYVNLLAIVFMYGTYTIGLIVSKPENKLKE